jgi:hypothetical protein
MPDYSKTSFYKLECKEPEVTEIYVGSTTNFKRRKSLHKGRCINKDGKMEWNQPVYCFMRLHGGWENWNMIEIDEVNCRSKRHKNQIEAKYIRDLGATLNTKMPQDIGEGLGKKEWNNKYREKNRDSILEKKKKHYEKNAEKIAEKKKVYYEKNREKFAERRKVKVVCECGSEITKHHLAKHKRTQKHQDWENLPEPNLIFVEN